MTAAAETALYNRIFWRIIPFLFLCYVAAFLDRVNVGFAKLQMAQELGFSDAVYGFGAGIFFIGYFLFEVPSNLALEKVGAKLWIVRIMVTWGIISSCMMLVETEFWFYTLRFLLGAAEAGFFPGIILYLTYWFPAAQRCRMMALFLTAVAVSNAIGAPISGAIMQWLDGANGWQGWQWLFLLEGLPSVLFGLLVLVLLDDGPGKARWLSESEKAVVLRHLAEDETAKQAAGLRHRFADVFRDQRVWALSFTYLCMMMGFYAVNFWMPTIIQEFGVDTHNYLQVGLLSMVPWGTATVAMVLNGSHSDKTAERFWHAIVPLLIAAAGLLGLALVGHAAVLSLVCLMMITTGLLSAIAVFWSIPAAFLSGTAAAAGIAWINSLGNLGGFVGPELIGRMRTATDSTEMAFFTLAGFVLLGSFVLLILRSKSAAGGKPSNARQ
ncbi:MAG TPA: MFS transporter [Xanthomonadales bacterium]|nr:MFS transporter [Xanthomonadales bacterium]